MSSNMNDRLFHIFKSKTFAFCLVCKEDIPYRSDVSVENCLLHHLHSSCHQESIRSLFKMCIPDPLCDSLDKQCVDVVTRSVFEIAVLQESKGSYICQDSEYYVCLMCNMNISRVACPCEVVKQNIVYHLESECHSTSVKDVCWFYRFKSEEDYLLFHKSVIYCSICNSTCQCRENNLLQTVVRHLQTDGHCKPQPSDSTAEEKYMRVVCPQCRELVEIINECSMQIHFQKHKADSDSTENLSLDCEDYEVCSACKERVMKFNENSELLGHKCKVVSHENHHNTSNEDTIEYEMSFEYENETRNVLEIFGYEGLKIAEVKINLKFIKIIKDHCFCILCWMQLSRPKHEPMLISYLKHFKKSKHKYNVRISLRNTEVHKNNTTRRKCKILRKINQIIQEQYCHHQQGEKRKKEKIKIKANRNKKEFGAQEKEKRRKFWIKRRKEMRKANNKKLWENKKKRKFESEEK